MGRQIEGLSKFKWKKYQIIENAGSHLVLSLKTHVTLCESLNLPMLGFLMYSTDNRTFLSVS